MKKIIGGVVIFILIMWCSLALLFLWDSLVPSFRVPEVTNDTSIKIPHPADCKTVISEEVQDDIIKVVYQTTDGDVAISTWKIVYEGTARLSDSKSKKDADSPILELDERVDVPDIVDKIKEIATGTEEE